MYMIIFAFYIAFLAKNMVYYIKWMAMSDKNAVKHSIYNLANFSDRGKPWFSRKIRRFSAYSKPSPSNCTKSNTPPGKSNLAKWRIRIISHWTWEWVVEATCDYSLSRKWVYGCGRYPRCDSRDDDDIHKLILQNYRPKYITYPILSSDAIVTVYWNPSIHVTLFCRYSCPFCGGMEHQHIQVDCVFGASIRI